MTAKHIMVTLLAATLALTAQAEQTLEQRLEALDQEIRILKRQRELEKEEATAKPKPAVLQADDKGFGFKSADGNFAFRAAGQIKADGSFYLDDDTKAFTDAFSISSARLILTGTLYKNFTFTLAPEFGGSSVQLLDAFLEWNYWPAFKVRAGRWKQPFGLERLQSDVNTWFTTLGLPSQLVPARDIALQVGGDIGVFNYALSIGNGVVDGGSALGDTTDDKELTGRIWVSPFQKTDVEALQGLSVGIAGSFGIQGGQTNANNLASYRTAGNNTFFSYRTGSTNGSFATGERIRVGPQFSYYYGRLGVIGEYVLSSQEVARLGRTERLEHSAWQIAAAFALTDDKPAYRGLNPKKPFSLKDGTWGAFELVGRIGQFDVDNDAFAGAAGVQYANPSTSATKATSWGVGLNWYLNKNVRTFLDYDQTSFDGGAGTLTALKDRPTEHFLSTRFQLTF